jgi:hypothetical protein
VIRKGADQEDDPVLRAKYLDWCSARVAERFVKLTPEEIYALAEQASQSPGSRPGSDAAADAIAAAAPRVAPVDAASASFKTIVEQVTAALAAELVLPGFDAWAAAYREDPSRYDGELLGLWREPL